MSRNRVLWIALFCLVSATLACIGGGTGTLPVGEIAPAFGVKRDGKTVTLEDLQGSVVIIVFWSST
jgi:hypothetical protein